MKTENVYCDLCKKRTTDDGKQKEIVHGFTAKAGYSNNGWGQRRDFFPELSLEVCRECFIQLQEKVEELKKLIATLRK